MVEIKAMTIRDASEASEHAEFIDTLLGLANANTLVMRDMTDEEAGAYLKGIIDSHAIVWAIWPDDNHPTGLGLKLVTDKFGLQTGKGDTMVPINAIACPDEENAQTLVLLVEREASKTRTDQ